MRKGKAEPEVLDRCKIPGVPPAGTEEEGASGMYFRSPEDLQAIVPIRNGIWNKDDLYEYLVWSGNVRFQAYISSFFNSHLRDENLAELLFSFLLSEEYDGSDCQMGAARLIAKMDRQVLCAKKELLRKAQENEVYWKRPFPGAEDLDRLFGPQDAEDDPDTGDDVP